MRDQLVFQDGVLFNGLQEVLESRLLLIVPSSLRDKVLYMNHDTRDSGHLGQLNTHLRVRKSFCIFNYVSTCAKCRYNKKASSKASSWFRSVSWRGSNGLGYD